MTRWVLALMQCLVLAGLLVIAAGFDPRLVWSY